MKPQAKTPGFTLIEVALVLLVLTLLLGGLLVPLGTQFDNRNIGSTQRQLDEIKESIVGYALQNRFLPCPDTTGDGLEDQSPAIPVSAAGTCLAAEGGLPWATLGVGEMDAWNSRFIYRVTPAFSQRPLVALTPSAPPFTLSSLRNLRVCSTGACGVGELLANGAVAVVVSRGRNRGLCGNPRAAANCGVDEQENMDADDIFVVRPNSDVNTGNGEFDDMVVWLSPYILFNRMVAAGLLPR